MGPLVFDYGLNVTRRFYEDIGRSTSRIDLTRLPRKMREGGKAGMDSKVDNLTGQHEKTG